MCSFNALEVDLLKRLRTSIGWLAGSRGVVQARRQSTGPVLCKASQWGCFKPQHICQLKVVLCGVLEQRYVAQS